MDIVPLSLKIAYTLFLCILVPVYWIYWGPKNFLWFSDIALLTTTTALWLESSLLASMMTLAVALPELAWNVDFFVRLITGRQLLGLSGYMFDRGKLLPLRALSLFQTVVALIVLPLTYWLTDPADNVNWVYGPGSSAQTRMQPRAYLALMMILFPLVIYLPTHLLLRTLFGRG